MSYKHGLFIIIFLAAFLRLTFLGQIPAGLHYKEATLGWRDQNLIKFGKDEFGRTMPLIFSNWQDFELPLATYLSLPLVAISKTDPFFLRLPVALMGILSVLGSILLTRKIFPQYKGLELWVGFLVALNPWGVWLSRITSEDLCSFNFVIWASYFLLSKRKNISVLLYILAILSSKILLFFGIPFFFWLILFNKGEYKKIFYVILAMLSVLVLFFIHQGGITGIKDNNFSVFWDQALLDHINLLRGQDLKSGVSPIISLFFYNKLYFVVKILGNILAYISPGYLFAGGDGNSLNGLSKFGPMLLVLLPFFITGLIWVSNNQFKYKGFLFVFFLSSFFPGIFLIDSPNSSKFILALYPFSLVIGIGVYQLKKYWQLLFIPVLIFNAAVVYYDAFSKESNRSLNIWHPNTILLSKFLKGEVENNKAIINKQNKLVNKIWLSDGLDSNPGPLLAYFLEIPFNRANLSDSPEKIYKRWVSRVDKIDIGNEELLKKNIKDYDLIITTYGRENISVCTSKITEIGTSELKYQVLRRCRAKDEI